MSEQASVEAVDTEAMRYLKLTIRYGKTFNQTMQVNPKENLSEIKQYLVESTLFHIYDNFHFEASGKSLPQYTELDTILTGDSTLDIVVDPYDERTSRYHVKKVQELVRNPKLWAALNYRGKQHKAKEQQQLKQKELNIESSLQPSFLSPLYAQTQAAQVKESLQFLNLSGYNPSPNYRKLMGDFFYLHLRTLQSIDYHITANPRGYYINNSNTNFFDPNPHPQYGRVFSSLFDLLCDISPRFRKVFDDVVENTTLSEVEKISQMPGFRHKPNWLEQNQKNAHKWNVCKVDTESAQLEVTGIKDWNEMFQAQTDLPAQGALDKLNKSKMFYKIYSDFIQQATAGAKALIQGRLAPLNPLDDKLQHIYIHNSVFYSIAQQTPYDYSQEKGIDATPTVSAVSGDLRNLTLLSKLNIPQLHVLHMVLIEYRGFKVIAQCIIPGILTSQQLQCSQYGSIDDGKSIANNKQFELLMTQVCQKLDLDPSVEFIEESGDKKKIAGSIEIKGILGSDKRKYILDLLRLSPRDYNYLGPENRTCVLRQQLIEAYRQSLNPKNPDLQILHKKNLEVKINVNLQTGNNFTHTEETPKQQQQLKNMAKFLRQICIPKVIQALTTTDKKMLSDSRGITKVFHRHGVNMRYLGQVCSHKLTSQHAQVKMALQRVILVKSVKHLMRMAMRQTSSMQISDVLSHLLNCIFSTKNHLAMLEQGKLFQKKKEPQVVQEVKKGKKKKDKQKTKTKVTEDVCDGGIEIPSSPYIHMKPSQIWEIVRKISHCRYGHELPQKIQNFKGFEIPFNKLAALRDICITIGLKIQRKQYAIFSNSQPDSDLPFQPHNIIQLQPIPKHIPLENSQVWRIVQSGDEMWAAVKIEQAMQLYNTAVQYMTGLYGGVHRDIAMVYHKIATIYYRLTDYESGIAFQNNCLEIIKLLYGQDNIDAIQSLSNIGLFCFAKGDREKALFYLYKSLFLCNFSFGQSYPQAIVNYMNISSIYQHNKQFQLAIVCMMETLQRIIKVYGKDTVNTATCYTALATLHFEISDFRQCIDYQEKSINVLKNTLKQSDGRLQNAINILAYYKDMFNKKKVEEEQSMKKVPGSKVESKPRQQVVETEENIQRLMLLRKLQQAKMNSRMGYVNR